MSGQPRRTSSPAPPGTASKGTQGRRVSRRSDAAERQADRAADAVARGQSVSGWSFSVVPVSAPRADAPIHRQGDDRPRSEEDKKKEALATAAEAALETPQGKKLQEKVLDDPLVKKVKEAATTPVGIALGVGAAGAGVAGLAAAGKELPLQPPAIPLDRITPGLSAQVTYKGPVNAPTDVGLTLTYREQGPKAPRGPTDTERIRAETARLRGEQERFRAGLRHAPGSREAREQEAEQAAIARFVASQSTLPGVGRPLIPLTPGATVQTAPPPEQQEKKKDEAPVQREPASAEATAGYDHDGGVDTRGVDAAVRGPGRPLEPSVRRSMEARFGYDFSRVRVHDDAAAAAAAHDVQASAFTVGEDIVFAAGRFDPRSPHGRHLLAHELAHVVQQARAGGGQGPVLHRRSLLESIGILLGLEEGTWTDQELHAYLGSITATGRIDGSYDADNKARAVVARWKRSSPGFDLAGAQKALLIKEMLDGPTLGEDEVAILDLLELSDAGDLRAVFGAGGVRLAELESDIDGDNRTRLDTFVSSRFRGGRDALAAGTVDVVSPPVPPGAPTFAFDAAALDARFDSDRGAPELIALVERFDPADRERALHHLSQVRRPRQLARVEQLAEQAESETDATRQQALARQVQDAERAQLKTERVLLHFFHGDIPATEADLRAGTSPADPARRRQLQDALRPPPSAPGATFRPLLPGEQLDYEAKLTAQLPTIVDGYYQEMVANRPPRTHTLAEFEAIGNVSKDETDAVFGRFYSPAAHPPLRADRPRRRGNIHDAYAETERELRRLDRAGRRQMAIHLLYYFFQSDSWVRRLNRAHDARPEFDDQQRPQNAEARILARLASRYTSTPSHVRRLNEIDRGWDASAQGREIYVQLFQPADVDEDRFLLWDVFQTLIHEYMHTLVHDDYDRYATSFGSNSNEYNTLIEGVDCLLSETVWEHVEPRVNDPALRTAVEGAANAARPPIAVPHPSRRRYPSFTEALALVDLAGVQAVYAAYFLGLVDRVGGQPARRGGRP